MRAIILAIAMTCGIAIAGTSAQTADADYMTVARAVLVQHIRPAYAKLDREAAKLRTSIDALCSAPSPAALSAAQDAFRTMAVAWSHVEHIRFGPVAEQHRYERFVFWPDPTRTGARQIAATLAAADAGVTDPETLAGKSVALQGLTALEVLLFSSEDGGIGGASAASAFRCRFAAAIGVNVAEMAHAVDQGWASDDGFAATFTVPGPGNPVYRTPKEVILELYKAFTTEIEFVKDNKLARALGEAPEAARAQRLQFWRSGMALATMSGNIEAITELFKIAFAPIVAAQYRGLDGAVIRSLTGIQHQLASTPGPLAETIGQPQVWKQMKNAVAQLNGSPSVAVTGIARAAGFMGLNALDGD
jgi:predicted lipoprotein